MPQIRRGVVVGALMVSAGAMPALAQGAYAMRPGAPSAVVISDSLVQRKPAQQSGLVTLTVKDSTLGYTISTLVHQAHLLLFFKSKDPMFSRRISLHVENMNVIDALTLALRGTGLVAVRDADGETILIRDRREVSGNDSTVVSGSVAGTVMDSATGEPVVGAKVTVQGTSVTAVSSDRGTFFLTGVPVGTQLVAIRAFGYKPAERSVSVGENAQRDMRVIMTATTTILSGVVTTATGVQSKLSVGSDITTINVDSVMKTAPISTVTDLLENRVPGLTVEHTSGTPGDPSRLLLRGAKSINGSNNPIVVVDGVRVYDPQDLGSVQEQLGGDGPGQTTYHARPSPLDQIDPNTIATIEVLKGPSASALYGSDAANGVIVITTKKGQPGRVHWSVGAMQGVSYIPGDYPNYTYVFGHATGQQSNSQPCDAGVAQANSYVQPCIVDSVRTFQALNNPRFSPLTSGALSSVTTTISGGATALTYSFTGSAQNTHGMTKLPSFAADQYTEAVGSTPPTWMRHPDGYVAWNGSGQIQATLSPQASLTVIDMLSNSTQHRTDLGLSAVSDLIGVYVDTSDIANTPTFTDFFTQITQATLTSTTNATLLWRVRPWLPLSVTAGYNRNQDTDKEYLPAGLPSSILPAAGDSSGLYDLGNQQATVTTLTAYTTIPISLGRGPGVQFAVGTNFVSQSTVGQEISTTQVPVGVSDPTTFPQTTATTVVQQTQSGATYGWFFEPQFQFRSRFFINPGIRFDGGTASGDRAGLASFPKTQVSYLAIDHTGQTGGSLWTQVLTFLRLRGAFGIAGVQPTPGQSLRLFSTPNVVTLDGGTVSTVGTALTTVGNTLLHPERSREMEVGFDAQWFRDRVTLNATYHDSRRIDAIEAIPVAPSILGDGLIGTSLYQQYMNVGTIRNRGLDVTGEARLLDRGNVTWSMNGSVSTNDNLVLSSLLSGSGSCKTSPVTLSSGGSPCVRVGFPLNAKFAPVISGYADLNGDGVIEKNEIFQGDSSVYVGSTDPRYTATFGTTLSFWHGRLSLAANGDYQNGTTITCGLCSAALISAANQPDANELAKIQGLLANGSIAVSNKFTVVNSLRLDAVSMNVTLPTAFARAVRAQQATLSLQGSNLGLWTNYPGKDPGAAAAISGLSNNDLGGLPLPETWRVGVRITQ